MFDRPREKKGIFISHSGSEWCIIENCRHCCPTRHYRQLKYVLVRSASRIWVTHRSFAMRLCLYLIDSRFCKILRLIFGIFTEESRIIQNWVVRIGVDIPNDGSIFIKCFIFDGFGKVCYRNHSRFDSWQQLTTNNSVTYNPGSFWMQMPCKAINKMFQKARGRTFIFSD